jgi:hypothetical protein
MHGQKQHGELKYVCSRYEDSDGRECEHNTVLLERLFEFACRLVTHSLGLDASEAALRENLRAHALRLRDATSDTVWQEQAGFWEAKVAVLTADAETAGRRMTVERDDAAYELLKQEYSRLAGEVTKAKAGLAKATAALSAGDELSIDEDVEAAVRIARHLAATLADPANREEACDILRRLGIQIGLTFSEQKFGPKRIVRRLKGGVVVYGDADFPAAARPTVAADTAENKTIGPEPDTLPANPFARARLAAVDPNARRGSQEPRSPPGGGHHEHGLKRQTRPGA